MRHAVLSALERSKMTPRQLINDALVRFERSVQSEAPAGVRPALLFSERDRIVRELRGFIDGRLAARLSAVRGRDIVALGREAAPFDAIVCNRTGRCYAVVLRRLPVGGARLESLRNMRIAAQAYTKTPLHGVLVYDFVSGSARLVRQVDVDRSPKRIA